MHWNWKITIGIALFFIGLFFVLYALIKGNIGLVWTIFGAIVGVVGAVIGVLSIKIANPPIILPRNNQWERFAIDSIYSFEDTIIVNVRSIGSLGKQNVNVSVHKNDICELSNTMDFPIEYIEPYGTFCVKLKRRVYSKKTISKFAIDYGSNRGKYSEVKEVDVSKL